MGIKRFWYLATSGLILLAFLMSCTFSGMSDLEFAKGLMKDSTDPMGLSDDYTKSKSSGSPGGDDPIQIDPDPKIPPDEGQYWIIFTNYTPGFAPNSVVNGTVEVTLSYNLISEPQTATLYFVGDLTVSGEHEGIYQFKATLIIDSNGDYTYSGEITIDGTKHQIG
jgi:hypothetical protein